MMYYWLAMAFIHFCGVILFIWALKGDLCLKTCGECCDREDDDDYGVAEYYGDTDDNAKNAKAESAFAVFAKKCVRYFINGVSCLLWEIVVVIFLFVNMIAPIVVHIANRKYELMYYQSKMDCEGDFEFVKAGDSSLGDRLVCKACGFVVNSTDESYDLMADDPVLLQTAKNRFEHQCKTQKWLEFEKSFWYRMAN